MSNEMGTAHLDQRLRGLIVEHSKRLRAGELLPVVSVTNHNGIQFATETFSRQVYSRELTNYKVVKPGWYAFNPSRVNVGSLARNDLGCDVCASPMYTVFELKSRDVDPEYFRAFVESPRFTERVGANLQGSVRDALSFAALESFPLNLPPLTEQRAIAEVLAVLQATIAKTASLIEQLGVTKNAILEECLLNGLNAYHTTSNNRKLSPQGWEYRRLRDVATIRTGISKSKERHISNPLEVQYLRVANVQDGYLDLGEVKTITIEQSQLGRYSLQQGDVLFNEGGDFDKLGRGCVWGGEIEPCVHQNHVFVVRCKPGLSPEFLALLAASRKGKAYFRLSSKQTTNLASINTSDLRSFPVLLPPMGEQLEIVAIARSFDERSAHERLVLSKIKRMHSAFAQELLSGRLRLPKSMIARFSGKPGRAA
jgi:type I restriction enzyme S subunit